jgi:ATP-dependent helicase/nuclease subunit A
MQRLDFTAADTVRQVEAQLLELQKKKQISEEEISLLNIPAIVHFFRTDIGKRAADAARRGQLYREKQFVIGVPASDIRPQWDKEEMVLVQGIIDAWFYEGDQIVLLDYKTDRVLKGQEQKLKERYQAVVYPDVCKQTYFFLRGSQKFRTVIHIHHFAGMNGESNQCRT